MSDTEGKYDSEPEYDDDDEYDYDYEYDDGDTEMKTDATSRPRVGDTFTVHSLASLSDRINQLASEVAEVLGLDVSDCSLILRHYKWNKLTVENKWFEREASVRSEVGLPDAGDCAMTPSVDELECPSCLDDVPTSNTASLRCGHEFCNSCWTEYFTTQLDDGPSCVLTLCMQADCGAAVPDDFLVSKVPAKLGAKYQEYIIRSFVEQSSTLRWCPNPGCTFASEYPEGGARDIECTCGHEYCFACAVEAHRPASCGDVELWQIKNTAESENVTWIIANTKKCPKCRTPIEKNQGCNHMTCRKTAAGCGHEFCWLCLGPWSEHGNATGGYYKCNKWEAQKQTGVTTPEDRRQREAKSAMDKYIHYFDRYINHERARRIAIKSLKSIQKTTEKLQAHCRYKLTDVTFIREAAEQVIKCRQVLKYTYVHAFYMTNEVEKAFFEHLQEMLEKNTEHLHGLVEKDLTPYHNTLEEPDVSFFDHRSIVANYTAITRRFLENLLKGVESGLTDSAKVAQLLA